MRPPNLSHRVFLFVFSSYKNTVSQKTNGIKIFIYCPHFIVPHEIFLFAMLHHREIVCCLPSYPTRKASGTGHLLVIQPHFGLRPVQQDRLHICPLQCRQRQQNISLTCAHKAGLSFAKILNCGGHFCRLSKSWQTKSD